MAVVIFDNIALENVSHVSVSTREPSPLAHEMAASLVIEQIDVFCAPGANHGVFNPRQEGVLQVDAEDENGTPVNLPPRRVILQTMVPRSFGPRGRYTQFAFRGLLSKT